MLEQFLDSHQAWNLATRGRQKYWIFRLLQFTSLPWRQIAKVDLVRFEQHLQWSVHGRGGLYSAQSTHQALRMLRTFFTWAYETGRIGKNPMQGWLLPGPPRGLRIALERAQVLRLLNLPNLTTPWGQRDALLLQLLYYQGLGLEPCRKLHCSDLVAQELEDSTKAALQRYLQDGRTHLEARSDPPEKLQLLLAENGRPYKTKEGLAARLRLYAPEIGLQQLSASLLRHSYRAHQAELQRRLPQF